MNSQSQESPVGGALNKVSHRADTQRNAREAWTWDSQPVAPITARGLIDAFNNAMQSYEEHKQDRPTLICHPDEMDRLKRLLGL